DGETSWICEACRDYVDQFFPEELRRGSKEKTG
ncbi:unnamed protein product, partial [marine sediment metagenome]